MGKRKRGKRTMPKFEKSKEKNTELQKTTTNKRKQYIPLKLPEKYLKRNLKMTLGSANMALRSNQFPSKDDELTDAERSHEVTQDEANLKMEKNSPQRWDMSSGKTSNAFQPGKESTSERIKEFEKCYAYEAIQDNSGNSSPVEGSAKDIGKLVKPKSYDPGQVLCSDRNKHSTSQLSTSMVPYLDCEENALRLLAEVTCLTTSGMKGTEMSLPWSHGEPPTSSYIQNDVMSAERDSENSPHGNKPCEIHLDENSCMTNDILNEDSEVTATNADYQIHINVKKYDGTELSASYYGCNKNKLAKIDIAMKRRPFGTETQNFKETAIKQCGPEESSFLSPEIIHESQKLTSCKTDNGIEGNLTNKEQREKLNISSSHFNTEVDKANLQSVESEKWQKEAPIKFHSEKDQTYNANAMDAHHVDEKIPLMNESDNFQFCSDQDHKSPSYVDNESNFSCSESSESECSSSSSDRDSNCDESFNSFSFSSEEDKSCDEKWNNDSNGSITSKSPSSVVSVNEECTSCGTRKVMFCACKKEPQKYVEHFLTNTHENKPEIKLGKNAIGMLNVGDTDIEQPERLSDKNWNHLSGVRTEDAGSRFDFTKEVKGSIPNPSQNENKPSAVYQGSTKQLCNIIYISKENKTTKHDEGNNENSASPIMSQIDVKDDTCSRNIMLSSVNGTNCQADSFMQNKCNFKLNITCQEDMVSENQVVDNEEFCQPLENPYFHSMQDDDGDKQRLLNDLAEPPTSVICNAFNKKHEKYTSLKLEADEGNTLHSLSSSWDSFMNEYDTNDEICSIKGEKQVSTSVLKEQQLLHDSGEQIKAHASHSEGKQSNISVENISVESIYIDGHREEGTSVMDEIIVNAPAFEVEVVLPSAEGRQIKVSAEENLAQISAKDVKVNTYAKFYTNVEELKFNNVGECEQVNEHETEEEDSEEYGNHDEETGEQYYVVGKIEEQCYNDDKEEEQSHDEDLKKEHYDDHDEMKDEPDVQEKREEQCYDDDEVKKQTDVEEKEEQCYDVQMEEQYFDVEKEEQFDVEEKEEKYDDDDGDGEMDNDDGGDSTYNDSNEEEIERYDNDNEKKEQFYVEEKEEQYDDDEDDDGKMDNDDGGDSTYNDSNEEEIERYDNDNEKKEQFYVEEKEEQYDNEDDDGGDSTYNDSNEEEIERYDNDDEKEEYDNDSGSSYNDDEVNVYCDSFIWSRIQPKTENPTGNILFEKEEVKNCATIEVSTPAGSIEVTENSDAEKQDEISAGGYQKTVNHVWEEEFSENFDSKKVEQGSHLVFKDPILAPFSNQEDNNKQSALTMDEGKLHRQFCWEEIIDVSDTKDEFIRSLESADSGDEICLLQQNKLRSEMNDSSFMAKNKVIVDVYTPHPTKTRFSHERCLKCTIVSPLKLLIQCDTSDKKDQNDTNDTNKKQQPDQETTMKLKRTFPVLESTSHFENDCCSVPKIPKTSMSESSVNSNQDSDPETQETLRDKHTLLKREDHTQNKNEETGFKSYSGSIRKDQENHSPESNGASETCPEIGKWTMCECKEGYNGEVFFVSPYVNTKLV